MTAVMHTHLKVRGTLLLWAIALAFALAALLPVSAQAAAPIIATGTVTDAVSGLPMEGAWIHANFNSPVYGWMYAGLSSTTGVDGIYTLHDHDSRGPGEYLFTAILSNFHSQDTTVTWDGVTPLVVNFALDPVIPIGAGTVTDAVSGLPIEGAWIDAYHYNPAENKWMWASSSFTDTSGAYTLPDQRDHGTGKYRVTVWAPGYVRPDRDWELGRREPARV